MPHPSSTGRVPVPKRALASALMVALALILGADAPEGGAGGGFDLDALWSQGRGVARLAAARYQSTPPADRVTWGGLIAAGLLGAVVVLERMARLRPRKIVPVEFSRRFLERMTSGALDRGKALDYCELNPSPAARVALAAVRRWGRPTADLERASALAHRVEAARLRKNVETLRRVAALAPLLGLLGTLLAVQKAFSVMGTNGGLASPAWGPALAGALTPMAAGVALSIVALVAYDGISTKVEALVAALDRVAAETVDAIAMSPGASGQARTPHSHRPEATPGPAPGPRENEGEFA